MQRAEGVLSPQEQLVTSGPLLRNRCPCSFAASPALCLHPLPGSPRPPSKLACTSQLHMGDVFSIPLPFVILLKKCHPSHSPGRPVSSCPRRPGPQTLPGRFSGLETAAQPGDCWGWVGARPRVGARAWPRDPTNTGSGVRPGLRTRGNVKEVPVQDPSCCLLGSPSEIFTPAFSHSGLSGGHLSPAGSGLPSLPPHRRTACVLTC